MRIGISCYPTFGGSGVIASELGMGLAERGHEVHFITYAVPGRLKVYRPGIYFHQVSVPDYPLFEYSPYSLALASKMADVADRVGLDLIHAHYAIPHAIGALLARDIVGGNLKVITTLHGTDITLVGRDPSFMPIIKYTLERSDALSAVSIFLRDDICRTFNCEKTIELIYNFIDPRDSEDRDFRAERMRYTPDGEKLLIHVSNFRKVKRVDDVIEIFLRLREEIRTKLILVGSGPELKPAVQKVEKVGAERDLIVLGNRETVNEIICTADLLLLPSETESFGMAALEAMACGVPPIVTDSGGLPEVVDDGITGCISPVGDIDDMVSKSRELLLNEDARTEMGRRAKEVAFKKFNLDHALDLYEDLYANTTGRASA